MAFDVSKKFGSRDPRKDAEWMEYEGGKFLIAPAGSPSFKKFTINRLSTEELMAAASEGEAALTKTRSVAQMMEFNIDMIVHCVLLDWADIEENGEPIAFDVETAKDFLFHYDELRTQIDKFSLELGRKKGWIPDEKKVEDTKKK